MKLLTIFCSLMLSITANANCGYGVDFERMKRDEEIRTQYESASLSISSLSLLVTQASVKMPSDIPAWIQGFDRSAVSLSSTFKKTQVSLIEYSSIAWARRTFALSPDANTLSQLLLAVLDLEIDVRSFIHYKSLDAYTTLDFKNCGFRKLKPLPFGPDITKLPKPPRFNPQAYSYQLRQPINLFKDESRSELSLAFEGVSEIFDLARTEPQTFAEMKSLYNSALVMPVVDEAGKFSADEVKSSIDLLNQLSLEGNEPEHRAAFVFAKSLGYIFKAAQESPGGFPQRTVLRLLARALSVRTNDEVINLKAHFKFLSNFVPKPFSFLNFGSHS